MWHDELRIDLVVVFFLSLLQKVQSEQEKLKHLEFVEAALVQAILYASKAYDFAKDKTGPLKPGVETLETHVKTVVGPAYEKLQDYPVVALKFVDRKVSFIFFLFNFLYALL